VDFLQGDATKARKELGWAPKIKFKRLVHLMVDADFAAESRKVENYLVQKAP
jgi:GDPmannose 4,6-dehydratase